MSRNQHKKDFILGAMLGSTLGALSAMMFASKQGHKIQDQMADKYHEFEDAVKSYAFSKKKKVKKAVKKMAKRVTKKVKQVKRKIAKA